jgi:hypothetical protein
MTWMKTKVNIWLNNLEESIDNLEEKANKLSNDLYDSQIWCDN